MKNYYDTKFINKYKKLLLGDNEFKFRQTALLIAFIYSMLGFFWILFSDRIVLSLFTDAETLSNVQTYKGWFFIFVSAIVIYLLVAHQLKIRFKINNLLQKKGKQIDVLIRESGLVFYMYDVKKGRVTWYGNSQSSIMKETTISPLDDWVKNIHPDDLDKAVEALDSAEKSGSNYKCEYRWMKGDDFIYVEDFGFFDIDKIDNTKILIGFMKDISDFKRKEKLLADYSENLENLVKERTKDLELKNEELKRFNKLFVGREFRIKELKDKLKQHGLDNH